jgi:hypothetical protein
MCMSQRVGEWSARMMAGVDLGDRRRVDRARRVLEAMAAMPGASIPMQMDSPGDAKAAYRLFAAEQVTFEAIGQGHWQHTREIAGETPITLLIQDTTRLNFGFATKTRGLGPIGAEPCGKGLLLHTTLAVAPDERVLGVAHQALWSRTPAPRGETRAARRVRPKESDCWTDAITAVGKPPPGCRWVHVGDREADIYGVFARCVTTRCDCVVRVNGSAARRRAAAGHELNQAERGIKGLQEITRKMPDLGRYELDLRGRDGHEARSITLVVNGGPVTIYSPRKAAADEAGSTPLWAVRACEQRADGQRKPGGIEWTILTTVPVTDEASAMLVIGWYSRRWLIEEYHKCLKTGCSVEKRQLEEASRLMPLIGLLCITAARLLGLKLDARRTPDKPASRAVPSEHVRMIAIKRGRDPAAMTCREFWRETAKLGGFMGRKGDGDPGWQTLWRGWQLLDAMVAGAMLYHNAGP